jgi:hypothetical protein
VQPGKHRDPLTGISVAIRVRVASRRCYDSETRRTLGDSLKVIRFARRGGDRPRDAPG